MKHTLTPQENKKIDKYWNEHDGDTFYKDELKELVAEIKHNVMEKGKKCTRGLCSKGCEICEDDPNIISKL